ncbi:hypothetical protein MNV49_006982 [Pseudohyphozyma bogoriensis]|nr:hypothetical protein MNV49_006982 [Pseudohyphozyma bogoriensis]
MSGRPPPGRPVAPPAESPSPKSTLLERSLSAMSMSTSGLEEGQILSGNLSPAGISRAPSPAPALALQNGLDDAVRGAKADLEDAKEAMRETVQEVKERGVRAFEEVTESVRRIEGRVGEAEKEVSCVSTEREQREARTSGLENSLSSLGEETKGVAGRVLAIERARGQEVIKAVEERVWRQEQEDERRATWRQLLAKKEEEITAFREKMGELGREVEELKKSGGRVGASTRSTFGSPPYSTTTFGATSPPPPPSSPSTQPQQKFVTKTDLDDARDKIYTKLVIYVYKDLVGRLKDEVSQSVRSDLEGARRKNEDVERGLERSLKRVEELEKRSGGEVEVEKKFKAMGRRLDSSMEMFEDLQKTIESDRGLYTRRFERVEREMQELKTTLASSRSGALSTPQSSPRKRLRESESADNTTSAAFDQPEVFKVVDGALKDRFGDLDGNAVLRKWEVFEDDLEQLRAEVSTWPKRMGEADLVSVIESAVDACFGRPMTLEIIKREVAHVVDPQLKKLNSATAQHAQQFSELQTHTQATFDESQQLKAAVAELGPGFKEVMRIVRDIEGKRKLIQTAVQATESKFTNRISTLESELKTLKSDFSRAAALPNYISSELVLDVKIKSLVDVGTEKLRKDLVNTIGQLKSTNAIKVDELKAQIARSSSGGAVTHESLNALRTYFENEIKAAEKRFAEANSKKEEAMYAQVTEHAMNVVTGHATSGLAPVWEGWQQQTHAEAIKLANDAFLERFGPNVDPHDPVVTKSMLAKSQKETKEWINEALQKTITKTEAWVKQDTPKRIEAYLSSKKGKGGSDSARNSAANSPIEPPLRGDSPSASRKRPRPESLERQREDAAAMSLAGAELLTEVKEQCVTEIKKESTAAIKSVHERIEKIHERIDSIETAQEDQKRVTKSSRTTLESNLASLRDLVNSNADIQRKTQDGFMTLEELVRTLESSLEELNDELTSLKSSVTSDVDVKKMFSAVDACLETRFGEWDKERLDRMQEDFEIFDSMAGGMEERVRNMDFGPVILPLVTNLLHQQGEELLNPLLTPLLSPAVRELFAQEGANELPPLISPLLPALFKSLLENEDNKSLLDPAIKKFLPPHVVEAVQRVLSQQASSILLPLLAPLLPPLLPDVNELTKDFVKKEGLAAELTKVIAHLGELTSNYTKLGNGVSNAYIQIDAFKNYVQKIENDIKQFGPSLQLLSKVCEEENARANQMVSVAPAGGSGGGAGGGAGQI